LRVSYFAILVSVCTAPGWSQGSLGGLTGVVSDPTGAAVPSAVLRITNLGTEAEVAVQSSTEGTYLASGLAPGQYRITISKPGFKTFSQAGVSVSTATFSTVDISMVVGDVSESVTVTGGAAELQAVSSEIGTIMPEKAMLDLPISLGGAATMGATGRRQIENFIYLTPGVTGNQYERQINGAPGFSAGVLIDGIDTLNIGAPGLIAEGTPPYEAVQEFKVQNTLYPAEYGLGFGILNFSLKSGANKFHGDLFEFIRNDKLDARGFFSATRPPLQQNEYGGTFGGPLLLPNYNGRDKTFFFFAYSGFQLRGGLPTSGLITLPSAQERSGNFSDYPFPTYNPSTTRPDGAGGFTRDPFTDNQIPVSLFSAVAQRSLPLIPEPDIPGSYFNNYVDRSHQPSTDNDWSIKIDHIINSKQHISGAYWWVHGNTQINGAVAGAFNPSFRNTPTVASGYRFNHEFTITPTLVNHAAFGYTPTNPTWAHWTLDPRLGNEVLQIPGIPVDSHGYPTLSFSSLYPTLGNSNNNGTDPQYFQNWNGVDDLSWVKGRHQLKFGFEYRRRKMTLLDRRNEGGTFNFSALSTSQPDSPDFANDGNAFASFLLGQVYSASRAVPAPLRHFVDGMTGMYVDDGIKVTTRLTITLGLRYEIPSYAQEQNGIISELSLTTPNPGAGGLPGALVFLGQGEGRTGTFNLFGSYYKSLSPRFGAAYSVDKQTVIRAGYGIFRIYPNYGRLNGCNLWCSGFGLQPSVTSTNQGVTPAFLLDTGFPASPVNPPVFDPALNNGGSVSYINEDSYRPALMQSWTLDLQRNLHFGILLDLAYVGSKTNGLWSGLENINQVNPAYLSLGQTLLADINSPQAAAAGIKSPYPGFTGSVAQALRPYPQYTAILDMYQPTGYNQYESLQVRVQKRYSNGLSFLFAYTFSKNIGAPGDDTFGDIYGGGGQMAIDTFNRKLEKSLVDFDQTHLFVLSWTYELPFGKGKEYLSGANAVVRNLVGGWQINSIETYRSGTPIAISGGPALPLFGGGNRPNWISSNVLTSIPMSQFDPSVDRYLNIDAFSQPAPFTFGNAPPVLPNVRTPFFYDEDFSVFKNVYFRESAYVQFRAEFYDILNRVVFSGPAADVNSPATFGVIGSQANTPRVIQFAMKLIF
jgi:Carboxypeptidase regulatory-like domain